MIRFTGLTAACLIVTVVPGAHVAAEDVLSVVPDDVLGAVVIRNADDAQQKLQKLAEDLELPIPNVIDIARQRSGLSEGIDAKGSITAILSKPPEGSSSLLSVVYCVATSDYQALLSSINAEDAVDGVSAATIKNRQLLVAEKNGYALIAAARFEDSLRHVLSSKKSLGSQTKLIDDRIAGTDVCAVITPNGLKMIQEKLLQGLAMVKAQVAAQQPDNVNAVAGLVVYESIFESLDEEYTHGLIGLQISDDGVRFLKSGLLSAHGTIRKIAETAKPMPEILINDFADESFVFAGAGVFPTDAAEYMMEYSMKFMNMYMKETELTDADLSELTRITKKIMDGMHGMSFALGTAKEGKPLYENTFFTMQTDNAAEFLANYETTIKEMNGILGKAENSPFKYDTGHSKLGGYDVLELYADMSGFLQGQPVPQTKQMMEMMFGNAGEMTVYLAAANEKTVIGQYISKDRLLQRLKARTEASSIVSDVFTTRDLLPKEALGVGFWSPAGTFRMVRQLVGALQPVLNALPEFPDSPPVGMSLTLKKDRVDVDAVAPTKTLQAISRFIRDVREMRNAR